MKVTQRFVFIVAVLLLVAGSAFGQGTTGSLNGTVTHEGAPLPGVTITISSPNLQGTRVGVSNVNGDFNFPALPPGDYTVKFEMEGMGTVTKTIKVGLAKTERVNALMQLSSVAEAITVTAAAPAVLETTEVQSNYSSQMIEDLPIGRTVQATTLLAPGVTGNGPAGAIVVSGAYAYDTLYLVNGAVTNENVRGQTDNLYIEDAIQETSIITGSVSAEYGRFTGGVVSAITKSGGNDFTGSFRDSFTNPSWTNASDFGEPDAEGSTDEVYEATLGGRIIRDRLWFFGAGRNAETTASGFYINGGLLADLGLPTVARPTPGQTDDRYEVKLTGQITPKHSLVGSYLSYEVEQTNYCAFGCWEESTLDPVRNLPREMYTAQYNGIMTSNFLVEAGYSSRELTFEGSGSDYHVSTDPFSVVPGSANFESQIRDLARGTWAYDYTIAGGMWGDAVFCGFCDPEGRSNDYYLLKGTYYLATAAAGTHNLVAGYENFAESRLANNYQSTSNFDIYTYSTAPEFEDDGTFRPIINYGDVLRYVPVQLLSKGSDFVTDSIFVNDKWDFGSKWSFNIGARYDKNDGKDSAGAQISDDSNISPRIGVIYDINGDGRFRVNASYSKYVSRIQETIGGGAGGGNPSYFGYYYTGDQLGGRGTGMGSFDVITEMLRWFYENGGIENNPNLIFTVIPGANTRFDGSLKSPNVNEFTVGFGTQVGSKGFVRFDYIDKDWKDFYSVETSPGDQVDVLGSSLDVRTTTNNNDVEKTYQGISVQANYRVTDRFNVGGNYTWSEMKGNEVGENTGGGPAASSPNLYREYKAYAQNNPIGYLPADQTHKARIWMSYDQPIGMFGNLNFSLLERFDSGTPYSASVTNLPVRAFVPNPGYATPPASNTYYFSDRGEYRFEDATATDLALNWELPIKKVNVFLQGELINAFDEQAQIAGNTGNSTIQIIKAFNPFTETPVEGVNWAKRSTFGAPTGAASFQQPMTYRFSAGIRF
ncbi:MAG: TonB-dependent receptor [Thermoanaerobaculia bacterium]